MIARALIAICLLAGTVVAANPKPSGPLKAFKGPEGELVLMVEVNDGKQMLVQFRDTGGAIDGKTLLYEVEATGHGNKDVYSNYKRGSKWYRAIILTRRDGDWDLYPPGTNASVQLAYREKESAQYKAEDLVNAYKP